MKSTALAAAFVVILPGVAFAAHGKVGLWSTNTTVTMSGMAPQTHAATFCMTAQDVDRDAPRSDNPDCSYDNVHVAGGTIDADMICRGQFNATGHFQSVYDSNTHYTAHITITTDQMTMINSVDGKWLKADCTGATH
jgi:Protein of unknown function (DUF3617)